MPIVKASPGISPASPWARATPHPRATKREKKKFILYIKKRIYTYTSEKIIIIVFIK